MSELENLLEGVEVELKNLGSVAKVFSGGTPRTSKAEFYDGEIPWIRSGEVNFNIITTSKRNITEVGLASSSAKMIRKNSVVLAMTGANVGRSAVIEFSTSANQSVAAIETIGSIIDYKFLFYFLSNIYHELKSSGQGALTSLNLSMIKKIPIPIPCPDNPEKSIKIQKEIVRILDTFTELTTELTIELTTELTARKKQYSYYREQLLTFDESEVKHLPMDDKSVGEFIRGKRFVKTDMISDGVPCIHYGEMYTHYDTWADKTKSFVSKDLVEKKNLRLAEKGDVVIVAAGETIEDIGKGTAWLGKEGVVIHDACFYYKSDLNPKYVAYFTRTRQFHDQIKKHIRTGKISAINAKGLGKAIIPIPSPEEQERIVNILDNFDMLKTSLSEALPKEIELRKKQYEYFRNKLLTFPKDTVEA
jgi:type I restriction enzyme S subunit